MRDHRLTYDQCLSTNANGVILFKDYRFPVRFIPIKCLRMARFIPAEIIDPGRMGVVTISYLLLHRVLSHTDLTLDPCRGVLYISMSDN